jgi:hypothetical protein
MPKLKNKERIVTAAREKWQFTNMGKHIRITSDLSAQTLKARTAWCNVIQAMKEKNCQPRIPYPAQLPFSLDGDIRPSRIRIC